MAQIFLHETDKVKKLINIPQIIQVEFLNYKLPNYEQRDIPIFNYF